MASEIELKLAIDATAIPRLLRHPAVRSLRRGRVRTRDVCSTYFDTATFRLRREDVALRIRKIGDEWRQTVKGPQDPRAPAGLHARAEYEWTLARHGIDAKILEATPWRRLFEKVRRSGPLVPVCTTEFRRTSVPLAFGDGTLAELCADVGEVRAVHEGRASRAAISEIEIELESGDATNVFQLALTLAADFPLAVSMESKASRGYALRRGNALVVDAPVRASTVSLTSEAKVADALSALACECLRHVAVNAPGLIADNDPEWVHQMRVGTRRLRSCLSLAKRVSDNAALESVRGEVKWLAGILGKARDWDVLATVTLPRIATGDPSNAGLKRLRSRMAVRRRAARSVVRAAVASPRFQRLLLAAGLLCEARFGAKPADKVESKASPSAADDRADDFAARLLERRDRKFARLASHLARASTDERHQARIAAKRLRYAAEFFAPLFARKRTKAYIATLTDVQDVLGRLNDANTAVTLASGAIGPDDPVARAVRKWAASEIDALEPRMAKASRRARSAKPFWK